MKKIVSIACLFAAAALLAGCPKKATTVEPPTSGSQVPGAGGASGGEGASTSTSPLGGEAGTMGVGPGGGPNQSVGRIIYFDFDKSDIKPEFAAVITGNAQFLAAHPNVKLKLEGNTDERGTREYNIALGERRGNTVAQALESQGVSAQQLSVVSYGEERPVALGHDEASWSQNRRVDLVQQ